MRALVERNWPDLALDQISAQVVEAAQRRRHKDRMPSAKTIGALLPYTDFADTYEIIAPRQQELPQRSMNSIQSLNAGFQRIIAIRNQVAHTRPMKLDDTAFTVDESSRLVTIDPDGWTSLAETMRRIARNPSYVLGITPSWRTDDSESAAFNNLPIPEFDETGFFGRREELKKLKRLVKGNYPVVSVLGTGGIGKTALVIQAAYDLLDDPDRPFEAIVWVTAKSSVLTLTEITSITDAVKDSLGLFSQAAEFLGGDASNGDPISDLRSYLEAFKVLLILDNLETVLDSTLRDFLADIPVGSRVIITSRISLGMLDNPISLGALSEDDSTNLLYALCSARGVNQLRTMSRQKVAEFAGQMSGHPSYIRWFVAGLQAGKRPEDLLGDNKLLLNYCMSNVYEYLDESARSTLAIFQVLPGARNMAELAYLNDLAGSEAEAILLSLLTTNFVSMSSRSAAGTLDSTYFLADFAKEYLDRQHPVPRPRRAQIVGRNQDLRDQGAQFSVEMAATPFAVDTVTVRGVEDAHVARVLKSALSTKTDEDALALCREAQRLAPHYSESFRVEATIRARMLDDSGAALAFERALSLSRSPSTQYHFATFLLDEGIDIRRALEMLQAAAKADRTSPEIAFQISWAHYLLHNWTDSVAAARSVIDMPRATFMLRGSSLIVALRASCQHVEHEFDADRIDTALEGAEEAVALGESVGPDLLIGEPGDLIRLLANILTSKDSRLRGYYQQASRTYVARAGAIVSADPLKPERMVSSIARVVSDKGFGFVAAAPSDYFLHVYDLLNQDEWDSIRPGERCAFEPRLVNGGWRACDVHIFRL